MTNRPTSLRASGLIVGLCSAFLLMLPVRPALAEEVVITEASANQVTWDITVQHDGATLSVARADGSTFKKDFPGTSVPTFEISNPFGNTASDGEYSWQLIIQPKLSAAQKNALILARKTDDPDRVAQILADAGIVPIPPQAGSFGVADGRLVPGNLNESTSHQSTPRAAFPLAGAAGGVTPDQLISGDLVVHNSLCVGFDCVNPETFGSDTIKLKENNLRIKFEDTSVGTFPSTDWQLTANDSASGGQNKFSIEDITAARVPFTVEGSSPTNSIYVDSSGRVGFRTATPVLDLHVATGNTPGLRLEQTSASGFSAQSWDVAGNETNFFIRDVTNGSKLPFRIRPNAPSSSIDISATGNVGIGTTSPTASLHVRRTNGTAKVSVTEASGTTDFREMITMSNNGEPFLIFENTNSGDRWSNGLNGGSFQILQQADPQVEFSLTAAGALTISGALTQNSSRDYKKDFAGVDGQEVLNRVRAMPISTWVYKEDPKVRHMGPVAEDFFSSFQLGVNNKGIAISDTAGVALAAIQGLSQLVDEKDRKLAELTVQNEQLAERLSNLEKRFEQLAAQER